MRLAALFYAVSLASTGVRQVMMLGSSNHIY
jgi:hypothetical protein